MKMEGELRKTTMGFQRDLMPGRTFAKYKIVKWLSDVKDGRLTLLAEFYWQQTKESIPCVIKILGKEDDITPEMRERFQRQQDLLMQLPAKQTNLPTMYATAGQERGYKYLVFKYVEGTTLAERVKKTPEMGRAQIVYIHREITSALDYLHKHEIIHRNVRPSSIVITKGRRLGATLIGFGSAKGAEYSMMSAAGISLDAIQKAIADPYGAPEMMQGYYDKRGDLYGLGACLYFAIKKEPPTRGAQLDSGNTTIDHVCNTLLKENPEERYKDAAEALSELDILYHQLRTKPL